MEKQRGGGSGSHFINVEPRWFHTSSAGVTPAPGIQREKRRGRRFSLSGFIRGDSYLGAGVTPALGGAEPMDGFRCDLSSSGSRWGGAGIAGVCALGNFDFVWESTTARYAWFDIQFTRYLTALAAWFRYCGLWWEGSVSGWRRSCACGLVSGLARSDWWRWLLSHRR